MGSHAKYASDEKSGLFKLKVILPAVMMDALAHPGTLIPSRVICVIEAEQREEDGSSARNDRLIGVAADYPAYGKINW